MASTSPQKPYRNNDIYQLNKCTLCDYKTNVKSSFQRHLMKNHGVKLESLETGVSGRFSTLGRVANSYGISQAACEKFSEKQLFTRECGKCEKHFNTLQQQLSNHKDECNIKFKAIKNKAAAPLKCQGCGNIFMTKKNLQRHVAVCGKPKNICCQICAFKCLDMYKIQRHLIDKHNLICKTVDEPDFEQALNGTPYTLERAVEFRTLPEAKSIHSLSSSKFAQYTKCKRTFICQRCQIEFLKQKTINRHLKYNNCVAKGP